MKQKELELKIANKQTIDLAAILPETDDLLISSESAIEFVKKHGLATSQLPDLSLIHI